ncbi:hypothetical protein QPK87_27955 [Kamptonema cortianum]|nr:hypothetical protein [Geitlerinema splendidum]MDK3160362.1 hypothetical protein [Kamptonema cortianum]
MKNPILLIVSIACLSPIVGCWGKEQAVHTPGSTADVSQPIPQAYSQFSDLKPTALPPKSASLVLFGVSVPVQLEVKDTGDVIDFTWMTEGTSELGDPVFVESEQYKYNDSGFSLAAASHESYNPPIPLLKFPLAIGDSWEWEGKVKTGMQAAPAKATIKTATDTLNLETGAFGTVLVSVELQLDIGSKPSSRKFQFWFKPKEGLIRRELGSISTRELARIMKKQGHEPNCEFSSHWRTGS